MAVYYRSWTSYSIFLFYVSNDAAYSPISFFFLNDTPPTEFYPLSLHDALPISSIIAGHYEKAIDRESAYEKLQERAGEKAQTAGAPSVAATPPAPEAEKPSILAEALGTATAARSEEHTSELQSPCNLVCRLLLE